MTSEPWPWYEIKAETEPWLSGAARVRQAVGSKCEVRSETHKCLLLGGSALGQRGKHGPGGVRFVNTGCCLMFEDLFWGVNAGT